MLASVGGNPRIIQIWNPETGQASLLGPRDSQVTCLAAATSGCLVASGHADGEVVFWAPKGDDPAGDWADMQQLPGQVPLAAIAFQPCQGNLRVLAACSRNGTLRFWRQGSEPDSRFQEILQAELAWPNQDVGGIPDILLEGERPTCMAFCPTRPQILAVGSSHGRIGLYQVGEHHLELSTVLQSTGPSGSTCAVFCLSWSPHHSTGLLAAGSDKVRIWSAQEAALVQELEGHEDNVSAVAWSPHRGDGTALLASCGFDNGVMLWAEHHGQ